MRVFDARWRYVCWRLETYTGIPAEAITWSILWTLCRQRTFRQACWRFVRWRRRLHPGNVTLKEVSLRHRARWWQSTLVGLCLESPDFRPRRMSNLVHLNCLRSGIRDHDNDPIGTGDHLTRELARRDRAIIEQLTAHDIIDIGGR